MLKKYRAYRSYGHSRLTSALAAPDITLVLGIAAAVGLICGLSGCSAPSSEERAWERKVERGVSQQVLDRGTLACRDGVQYFVFYNTHGRTVTPRMKPDGTLYRCSIKQERQRQNYYWFDDTKHNGAYNGDDFPKPTVLGEPIEFPVAKTMVQQMCVQLDCGIFIPLDLVEVVRDELNDMAGAE